MYVNDPFELTLTPQLEGTEIEDEEELPPTPDQIFHEQFVHYPSIQGSSFHHAVDVCRFDETGQHIQMAKNCPHFEAEDEEGPRIREGWTVQQNVAV